MTHTPGPLHIQQDSKWPFTINVCGKNGEAVSSENLICTSSRWKSLDDARNLVGIHGEDRIEWQALMDNQMADMKLRAAAPDLLAVAEYARDILSDVFEGKVDPVTALDAISDLAVPAINKATKA